MFLQRVDNVFDLEWGGGVKYGEVRLQEEIEQSKYAFGQVDMPAEAVCERCIAICSTRTTTFAEKLLASGLVWPALEHCLKCSHLFNILDSSGSIGVTERTAYILRVRQLAVRIARAYVGDPAQQPEKRVAMDRELLIEIGCEEIPASWLPGLTAQMATHLDARLKEFRLTPASPAEGYSTPRRLTARVAKLAERQTDFEELVTGPPVSAAFQKDGTPTPAATGFAKKYGVEVAALERSQTPKGTYLAYRVQQRGKATVDVLADVMGGLLRDLTFPKQMRWDAYLDDGKGELVFARPIRWLVLMYGGRVVPFVIRRTEQAQGPNVQDIRSGSQTYGHRFLTTSGRAGRAIKIKTFEDYQARLVENFVILDRAERESRIRRELETHARRLGGRVSGLVAAHSSLLQEVPDLVEYPSVVAGHFPVEFLQLPEEVLTTTMIHHQHYFPVVDEEGKLKPAFLAVTNTQPEKPEIIARNSERVLMARLRDARFFWDEDRKTPLESRIPRLSTILFHKKLGTYREKADRVASLAQWIAETAFERPQAAAHAELAGRLCKGRPRHRHGARADRAAGHDGRHLRSRGRTCPSRCGRRSTSTTCRSASKRTRRRRVSSSAARRFRGRPSRWPTSSTPSSACSRPASARPDRAIRSACAGRRRAR